MDAVHRNALAIASLLVLLACLPWSALAIFGMFGAAPYETEGVCYAGRPLWALGQGVLGLAGVVVAGRAGFAGLRTAASGDRDRARRWRHLGYAAVCFAAWLAVLSLLEPEPDPVAASNCA